MLKINHKIQNLLSHNSSLASQLNKARLMRYGTYGVLAGMAIYALCFICPPVQDNSSHALTGTSIASDTTISISLSGNVLALDITPTSSSGTFATTADGSSTNSATVRVATNNITGYTLGIKASNPNSSTADKLISSNEQCENTPTSNKCAINSLSQPVTEAEYIDNTVEGINLNNTWGYAPSYYNSTTNKDSETGNILNYYPAPVNGDTIVTTDSPNQENTNTNDGTLQEDTYTIDFAARIDYTPYAGSYSTNYNNQSYIITAVGNPVPYSVSYNANKPQQAQPEASVDNIPRAQVGSVQGGDTVAVVLSDKVPIIGTEDQTTGDYTYAGYVFNGWCTVQPEEDQTTGYQTCPQDAETYQPGDTFGIDQTVENTVTLYATWGAPARVTFNSNGLIYNNTPGDTVNTVEYIPTYEGGIITGQRQNIPYTGTYNTPAYEETDPITNYIMKGWSTDQSATEATYENEQAIINNLDLSAGDNIELYAIWNYATVITFNGNGNDADNTPMADITIEAGQTEALPQNTYTKDGYVFNGWNTVQAPTEQDPGETYADQADFTAGSQSADVTLYAQWVEPPKLYDYVKALVKKSGDTELTQTAADLQAVITKPTSNDPSVDTSNSGVYKYNASVFGAASDASNDYAIYYYRGILDSNLDGTSSTYGSNGDGAYYPNYVKLGDTCWRIVRTTGSGGVKMIYNGLYSSGTTANSCANAKTNAQVATSAFNSAFNSIVYVGYTYNSNYKTNSNTNGKSPDVVFGNSDPTVNNTRSTIKTYIEDTWYPSKLSSYTSMLEPNAGYCNDRSYYGTTTGTTKEQIQSTISTSDTVYFGAINRNFVDNSTGPSLNCTRGDIDIYRYVANSTGLANELKVPAALLTADEAALAGSGRSSSNPTTYNANSYMRSGSAFWLLSPYYRDSSGNASEFTLNSSGRLSNNSVGNPNGVRPSISLNHETTVKSGTGTATDPWLINE